uniref:L1 transposable element RRM domain-containing protein n=1 Tax=Oryzias melastigma TaxID=30732 RepID=A0A3B3DIY2_ORYME
MLIHTKQLIILVCSSIQKSQSNVLTKSSISSLQLQNYNGMAPPPPLCPFNTRTLSFSPLSKTLREDISSDIREQMKALKDELRGEMTMIRQECKADINALKKELSPQLQALSNTQREAANTQCEMRRSLSDMSDRVVTLEKSHQALFDKHEKLSEKYMDLENRSRRQNLRIVGISEDAEGGHPSRFVADLLQQILGAENFDAPPMIDRAHRTLAPKPRAGEQKILQLSREKGKLFYKGSPVHIFPDITPEVGRLRAAFNPVKAKLRAAGVPYSLYFPARLAITVKGSRHMFTGPQAAETFARNIAPTEEENN